MKLLSREDLEKIIREAYQAGMKSTGREKEQTEYVERVLISLGEPKYR